MATETLERPTNSLSNWVKDVERLTKPEPAKEPDGKVDTAARPVEPKPNVGDVVADDGQGGAMGGTDATKGNVDGIKPDPKKAAPVTEPIAKAPEKGDTKEDWEAAPTPKDADWKKWKEGRKAKEQGYKKDISEREERIQALQNQVKEFETKVAASTELPETVKAEIKTKDDMIKALNDKIMVLDVTEHPKFKSYFQQKIDTAISKAKRLAGAEKAETIEKIIKLPEGEYRTAQLEEFLADIPSELTKSRLAVVMEEWDGIAAEREAAIADANQHKGKLSEEQQARTTQTHKQRQQLFDQTLKQIQDQPNAYPLFTFKEGDDAGNALVTKRIEAAKGLLFNPNASDGDRTKAAFFAVALPEVVRGWTAEAQAWKQEREGFEAQIAGLVAAQPKPGNGGGEADAKFKTKPGMKPHEITKGFVGDIMKMVNG